MNLPAIPSWANVALKFAPYVACAVLAGLLYLCHGNANALQTKLDAKSMMFDQAIKSRDSYYYAVQQRDQAILKQNLSIEALKEQAKVERANYEARLQLARQDAAVDEAKANELLSLKSPDGELNQCRAARDLLESELIP